MATKQKSTCPIIGKKVESPPEGNPLALAIEILGKDVQIIVKKCDWGEVDHNNIRVLLEDVASHIVREFRCPFDPKIRVCNRPEQNCPIVFYRQEGDEFYEINLTAKGNHWSQYSYQFSHELCHIISGYEQLKSNLNNWFHESICEAASIFTLRRMAERWRTQPPYPHWADYSQSLSEYVRDIVNKSSGQSDEKNLSKWLNENEDELRKDRYLREKNMIVALRMLPVFEENPQGWNAVTRLPNFKGRIGDYIEAWKDSVLDIDQRFVENIRTALLEG